MCEICGGPHFTRRCPYSAGYSTDYCDHHYSQVQSHDRYRTHEELLAWVKDAKEERDREIQAIMDSMRSKNQNTQGRYSYDCEGNYLGFQLPSGEIDLSILEPETIIDVEVPPPVEQGNYYYDSPSAVSSHQQFGCICCADDDDYDLNRCMDEESEEIVELVEEVTSMEDVEEPVDDETVADSRVRYIPSVEEVNRVDWRSLLDGIQAKMEAEDEETDKQEPESLTDQEVPPLVQQEIRLQHFPTNDDFFSDDEDDEVKVEVELTDALQTPVLETLMDESQVPPPVRCIFDFTDPDVEEHIQLCLQQGLQEEVHQEDRVLAWEEEFGDELVDFPTPEEEGYFDPVGDLDILQALLEGKPTLETNSTPNEQVEEEPDGKFSYGLLDLSLLGFVPSVTSHSIYHLADELIPRSRPSRKRIREIGEVSDLRTVQTPSVGIVRADRLLGYILRIIFGPSRFKSWWTDQSERVIRMFGYLCLGLRLTEVLLPLRIEVVLSWIKEKPPDLK